MSYERAYIACIACHRAEEERIEYLRENNPLQIPADSKILAELAMQRRNTARFNAMEALEGVVSDPLNLFAETGRDTGRDANIAKARKLLKACEGCNYSEPIVAELLQIK